MHFSRRLALKNVSAGFGYLAFAGLCSRGNAEADVSINPLAVKPTHFPAKAKRVIFLCMQGGPSHVDTFDYKPQLINCLLYTSPSPPDQRGSRMPSSA